MSRLSAAAKPFAFNPQAKEFVWQPAAEVVVQQQPPTPKRKTYTVEEMFDWQQPLYSGSNLELCPDADLSSILLYNPCFDYIAAGLVTAVPIEEAMRLQNSQTEGGHTEKRENKITSPRKVKKAARAMKQETEHSVPAHSPASTSPSSSSPSRSTYPLSPSLPSETHPEPGETSGSPTSGAIELRAEVVDGVRQLQMEEEEEGEGAEAMSESEDEDQEESESEASAADEDANDVDGFGVEGDGAEIDSSAPQQQTGAYMWSPQSSGAAGGALDDSSLSYAGSHGGNIYYFNQAAMASHFYGAGFPHHAYQENTSFHAERRRQKQSQYFSHFNRHDAPSGLVSSRFARPATYSPPLMAQRRDLYFQQDLHLHMAEPRSSFQPHHHHHHSHHNQHYQHVKKPFDPATHKMYDRQTLLELRQQKACEEKPKNLPPFLTDIYKDRHDASSRGRSLFGNSAAAHHAAHASATRSSLFDSSPSLEANTNHTVPGPDGMSISAAALSLVGLPPKRGGKLKNKRKKNKERSARQIEDQPVSQQRRMRIDSVDHDELEERKGGGVGEDEDGLHSHSSTSLPTKRGLGTPKHKPLKQKKGKKGRGNHGNNGGGGGDKVARRGGHHHNNFQLDEHPSEFEGATLADLHHCENKWTPSLSRPFVSQDALSIASKSARAILNKLSIDKLDALQQAMLALDIPSHEVLEAVVTVLFDKSVDEPEFAGLYAKFCAGIAPHMPEFTVHVGAPPAAGEKEGEGKGEGASAAAPASGPTVKTYSFRTMLLTKCYTLLVEDEESLTQSLMQQAAAKQRQAKKEGATASPSTSPKLTATSSPSLTSSPAPALTSLELSDRLHLLKLHQKGNLIFIGELFKQRLLTHSVVHLCLDMLLEETEEPAEWDVECVCTFLSCVGRKLDAAARGEDSDDEQADCAEGQDIASLRHTRRQLIESHFRKVALLSRHPGLASRFRFMLQDLLELRARNWVPRIQKTVDPKSLAEVREEAAASLATPMHTRTASHAAMTTVKKGGKGLGMHATMRTSVKAPSSRLLPSPLPTRTLQFHSPAPSLQRSVSAVAAFPITPLPSLEGNLTPGKYIPAWKRRTMGLDEGGLLPRSRTDDTHQDQSGLDTPQFDLEGVEEAHTQTQTEAQAPPSPPLLSPDDLLRQVCVLIDELYSSFDVSEAALCVSELAPKCAPDAMQPVLVTQMLAKCVEAKAAQRDLCVKLLHELFAQHLLSSSHLLSGVSEWVSLLADVAIDTPHAPTYTHAILSDLVSKKRCALRPLLALYAREVETGVLMPEDAAEWSLDLLSKLQASVDNEEEVQNICAAAEDEQNTLLSLFEGDEQKAQQALQQRGLSIFNSLLSPSTTPSAPSS